MSVFVPPRHFHCVFTFSTTTSSAAISPLGPFIGPRLEVFVKLCAVHRKQVKQRVYPHVTQFLIVSRAAVHTEYLRLWSGQFRGRFLDAERTEQWERQGPCRRGANEVFVVKVE